MDSASWRHAKDIISEALQRPASEREAFVRERCGDARLSAEILAMLAGFTQDDPLDDPIVGGDEGSDDLEPGTRIGPYVIVDRLGRGGMGQVFLGSDPRLERRVALKCLIRSLTGSSDRTQRILLEARAAARVNHPNVATVHDVLEHENRAFIVMEYVEGETLASRLARQRLSIDQVIAIGRQLASALAAAHAKGVVHRDLKPGNVQLTPDGTAKVLDFGIANAPRAALATSATATTQNGLQTTMRAHRPGTPPYMSPEQLLGRPIDARSDIYSLGVVLFEMATGRRPFPDSDALQVVVAQAAGAPRADAIDRRLPRSLGDVIDKALAMDVTARYQTAAEIGAALVEVERGLDRQREPVGKKLARVAVGVLIAVPTIGLLGVIKTIGFNNNFGRTGPFARFGAEPWTEYFRWGSFGIIGKVVTMTATAMIVIGALFVIHMLELIAPVGRVTKRVRAAGRRLALALDLDKPSNLAQAIAAAGIVAIVVLARRHIDLLNAFGSSFNSAPIATLLPMREAAPERGIYQVEMSILTLALAFGFYKVIQLRQRLDTREGRGALAVLGCVIAITVVMADAPYRSFNYRDFERVDYAGARCYVIGESGDDFLLLCPGSDPPRDRAVRRDDPRLHRLGIIENVFRGIPAAQNP